jgi:prophage regulatory protein
MENAVVALRKILRMKQLKERTGLSSSTLNELMNPRSRYFDPTFPPKIRLSSRAVGYSESALDAWLASRAQAN